MSIRPNNDSLVGGGLTATRGMRRGMCVCVWGGGGGGEISELAVQLRLPAESIITNPALLLDLNCTQSYARLDGNQQPRSPIRREYGLK